ncbi:fimbrillin family protein [uncultured Bacteroides sp.]|uniref:fimbrillin family protein n=1 Tax=uncultured Bacteroides sp. TaxID=162156 RepID=UPI0025FCC8DA|nr:fimbrillin family protein [uncultured Bacteroides sp.]
MKLGKFLFTGSLSLFALAACVSNDDKSEWNDGSQPISFTSSIQGLNTRAANAEWTAGDKVGIFMKAANGDLSAATAANKLHTTDENGILTASNADNALYYPTDGSSVDFVAYYPYVTSLAGTTYKVDVTTQTDQPAIDLLYSNNAKGFAKGSSSTPQLQFAHMLSQIVFDIEKDATIPTLNGLKVTFKGMNTKADFTLADGKLGNAGTVADIAANVDVNGATATTIVLPATALSDIKVVFDLNGKSYTADYPQTVLDAGRKYVHKVKLSDSNGQPVIVMEAATITDWIEVPGGDIDVDFGGGSVTPPDPTIETVVVNESEPYSEAFTTGQGKFTINDVTVPAELTKGVWVQDATYGMKASAFVGSCYASESWLLSPMIDLSEVTKATLTFKHAINMTKDTNFTAYYKLLAKKEGAADWVELSMTFPVSESWNYVSAGDIDLTAYVGSKVQIAFKYMSTASNAGTWEIKDLKVYAGENGGTDPTPSTALTNLSFETWTATAPEGWGRDKVTSATYSKSSDAQQGNNAVKMTGSTSNARFGSSDITLAAGTYSLSVYAKSVSASAKLKMGYAIIDMIESDAMNAYKYTQTTAEELTTTWKQITHEFTVDKETVASIFFVNAKSGAGMDLLIDNVSLIKK